ncbi:hypothetical protein GCM10011519_12400 [Marmoricola endophyticus]|uniref:Uncharacterized protein n=1 Tax=Marmoricola endophyticus TaxID=2040280 RepID=A0A917BF06_9ACTN|nr:hypothetical protein [Marmoricola endophyticus]GGF40238.1 hypothetical protein GCM10011519_12400 [Marmoricola endophyticus]
MAEESRVLQLDDAGMVLSGDAEVVLDVSFDGRRIWSFWLLRDSEPSTGGRFVAWPQSMRRFLDGRTTLQVAEHLSGRVLLDRPVQFGTAEKQIAVVNADGKPLGIDKSGRMAQTFDTRSAEQVAPLLDSIEEVLGALREAGIEAFPAYGTLLGAVREGRLIGHDSDADLGYVSRHEHPVDVVRESFRVQRALAELGYPITRYSGVAFKVEVREADGSTRGLDVFGGFMTDGRLYLMGEVGQEYETSWLFPLGTCTLEGRTLPAPADPGRMLAAMYGDGWRTPDPAFQFETPRSTTRRLDGWFRGTRVNRPAWDRVYSRLRGRPPGRTASDLARLVRDREGPDVELVDVGGGSGADAVWWAREGSPARSYDYAPSASKGAATVAESEGLPLHVERLNLLELRSVLGTGADLAQHPRRRALMARHLIESTTAPGRRSLWRLASMALREGGRLYLETWCGGPEPAYPARMVPVDRVVAEVAAAGGEVVEREELRPDGDGRRYVRLVAEWKARKA